MTWLLLESLGYLDLAAKLPSWIVGSGHHDLHLQLLLKTTWHKPLILESLLAIFDNFLQPQPKPQGARSKQSYLDNNNRN